MVSLDKIMQDILFHFACEMVREGSRKKPFKTSGFQGMITTSFKPKAWGGVWGVEFFARVHTLVGSGHVRFLVREADIEFYNEVSPQLEHFESAPSRNTPMYN